MHRLIKPNISQKKIEMIKKKLTLLILLIPFFSLAQTVEHGALIFDLHKKKDQQPDSTQQQQVQTDTFTGNEQQKQPKERKIKQNTPSGLYTANDYKRDGVFKAWFHAGINGAQIDGDSYAGYDQIGLDAGVGALVRFHRNFSFSMSLDYSMKGAREQLQEDPNAPTRSMYQVQWDYIEVPLMVNVHAKELFMFGIGLQPGVMVRFKEWDQNGDNETYDPPEGQPHLFDLEGVTSLHFIVVKRVTLGVKFSYSLLKLRGPYNTNRLNGEYNNVLTFDVGYLLSTVKRATKKTSKAG